MNNIELEDYFTELELTVVECIESSVRPEELIEEMGNKNKLRLDKVIKLRKELVSARDEVKLAGYLDIGYFVNFASEDRIALFAFLFDISQELDIRMLKIRFEKYNQTQVIFSNESKLFDQIRERKSMEKDFELIDSSVLTNINSSDIFKYDTHYFKSDPMLNRAIYLQCIQNFQQSPLFLRLDPTQIYSNQPATQLNEAVMIPADPHWWKHLGIYKNNKKGGSYFLLPVEPSRETIHEYWEYHGCGIRSMQIIAKRNNDGNLSMMIEELSESKIESGMLIGRCIHLDTNDPFDTPFKDSQLNHLDLAINVYEGSSIKKRIQGDLAKGVKVEDASFRTHLLRIEQVPFSSVLLFSMLFFKSKLLLNEWVRDQFG